MEAFIGSPAVERVTRTDYAGLYEVVLRTASSSIPMRRTASSSTAASSIPHAPRRDPGAPQSALRDRLLHPAARHAVKVVSKGTRVIATFEDPNCGCGKAPGQRSSRRWTTSPFLFFLYPILSEDSRVKSDNIWCAKDKGRAWTDWVVDGKEPAKASCDTATITRNVDSARASASARRRSSSPTARASAVTCRAPNSKRRWTPPSADPSRGAGGRSRPRRGSGPVRRYGRLHPLGSSTTSAPAGASSLASRPASANPQRNRRTAPLIAPPVSCAMTRRSSGRSLRLRGREVSVRP